MHEVCKMDILNQSIDWRMDIVKILKDPNVQGINPKLRKQAYGYLWNDGQLFKKDSQGVLLTCLGSQSALAIMERVHEDVCGIHQAGPKMRWLLHRHGCFWSSMLADCIYFAKACAVYKRHSHKRNKRDTPVEFHPVIQPWPFRGWAMHVIG